MASLDTFWSIPPIQDAIAVHLSTHDFLRCILTCRTFAQAFIPCLWRSVHIKDASVVHRINAADSISKHRHLIRKIEWDGHSLPGHSPTLDHMLTNLTAPNLVTLFVTLPSGKPEKYAAFPAFVQSNILLRDLSVKGLLLRGPILQEIISVIAKHPSLENLTLEVHGRPSCPEMANILQSCCSLRALDLQFGALGPFSTKEPIATDTFQESDLEEFCLIMRIPWLVDIVAQFLGQCPRLKKLTLPSTVPRVFSSNSYWPTVPNSCPELEELNLPFETRYVNDPAEEFIGRFSSLKRIQVTNRCRLVSIHETILRHHGSRLVSFSAGMVNLAQFLLILGHSPALLTFSADVYLEWADQPWKLEQEFLALSVGCLKLETLRIWVDSLPVRSGSVVAFTDGLFKCLGSMTRLRDISLSHMNDTPGFTNSLTRGLTHLAGLQRVRRFCFRDGKWQAVANSDVELILDQWPRLMELFLNSSLRNEGAFRQRIRERRPWLEFEGKQILERGELV